MAVQLPDFASLGFNDPQAAGRQPQYPSEDPGAVGLASFGKGAQAAGGAVVDLAAAAAWRKSKIEESYATADLRDQLAQVEGQIKNETDAGKVTQLRGQLRPLVSEVAKQISEPDRRELWLAKHLPLVSTGEIAADQRGIDIWRGNYASGLTEKLFNAQQRASQTDDPGVHEAEANNIANLIDAGVMAGVIAPSKASEEKQKAGNGIITGTADWLDANGRARDALDFLQKNKTRLPPHVLETYTHRLEVRADQQGGQALADRVRGVSITGNAVNEDIPPEGRALLDTIAGPESKGAYNARWPGKTFSGFADHPRIFEPGPEGQSSAAGRYEIVASTWDKVAPKIGATDFSPKNQDAAAWQIAQTAFKQQTGGDLLEALKAGKTAEVQQALRASRQWDTANLGSYAANLQKYQSGGSGGGNAAPAGGGGDAATGRVDEFTNPALADEINAAPAAGEPIPLDRGGTANGEMAPPAGARGAAVLPDVDHWLRAIEADPNASQKQKDYAAAIVMRDWHRQKAAVSAATRQELTTVKSLIRDDEASIATTGQPVAALTPERVAAALGSDAADEFAANRATANRYFEQTHDFENLPQVEIDQRLDAMKPLPGQLGFARNLKAYETAQKRADDLAKLRATDPAAAVSGLPDVQAAAKGASLTKPETFAPLVNARTAAMDRIGIPEESRIPITRAEALQLWQPIGLATRAGDPREIKSALTAVVRQTQMAFGDQAQRALEAILREGKADHDTAGIAAALVRKLARNETPTQDDGRALDDAQKADAARTAVEPIMTEPLSGMPMPALPAPVAPGRRYPAPDGAAIDMLRQSPDTAAHFDGVYGPGAAAKVLKTAPPTVQPQR